MSERIALVLFHILCLANWICVFVAAWQGRWFLAALFFAGALLLSVGLFSYGASRELRKRDSKRT